MNATLFKSVELIGDETVNEFLCRLNDAVRKLLNITDDDNFYVEAVMDSTLVVWRWRYLTQTSEHIMMDYTRTGDDFVLDNPRKVRARTTYVVI
jgi:hypothetical protein